MKSKTIDETEPIQYLTPQEVSKRFRGRVSVRTLSNWRCLGTGPKYSKIGGRILYPLSEVEAWEKGRTVTSTSGYGKTAAAAVLAVMASPWMRVIEHVGSVGVG